MVKLSNKEYLFGFIGGGWNSVYATNKRNAKKLAVAKYGHWGIDMDTFRLNDDAAYYAVLLSQFH